ncbi:MAG: hypothetical protein A2284_09525 [Deltaproteobacteria bacterium RIFOXYA12_FULL_61_11]|nr:MAG: hypothetical protein A2284_09525 [Deltaproteobacteria bacterium RIFOXYA12_FULL_61_11]
MNVLLVVNPRKPVFPPVVDMSYLSLVSNLGSHRGRIYDLFMDLLVTGRSVSDLLREALVRFAPRVVAIGGMTYQFAAAQRIAAFVKAEFPQVVTVLGGWHVTGAVEEGPPGEEFGDFDFLIYGQGETTLTELCDALEGGAEDFSGIPGLFFRAEGTFVKNAWRTPNDLDTLALPQRDAYLNFDRMVPILRRFFTSHQGEAIRGCPHACAFCSNALMNRGVVRKSPVERVIEDMKFVKFLGGRSFAFSDENTTQDTDYFEQLCNAIIANRLNDLNLMTLVSTISVVRRPELMKLAKEAGFTVFGVGAESLSKKNLALFNKSWSAPELHRQAVELINAAGILHGSFLILGAPDDDAALIKHQFRAMQRMRTNPFPLFLTPLPGTPFKRQAEQSGLIRVRDYRLYDCLTPIMATRYLEPEQLEGLRTRELLRFYLTSNVFKRLMPVRGDYSNLLALRYLSAYLPLYARAFMRSEGHQAMYDWFRW